MTSDRKAPLAAAADELPPLPQPLRDLLLTLAHDLRHAAALLADQARAEDRRRAGRRRLPRRGPD